MRMSGFPGEVGRALPLDPMTTTLTFHHCTMVLKPPEIGRKMS